MPDISLPTGITADNQQEPAAAADAAIEAEARRGGWRPKEEFVGDPSRWVDAKKFVERGRDIAPHLARQAGELRRENEALRQQVTSVEQRHQQELEEMRQQVAGLTQFRQEFSEQQRKAIREEALAEFEAARTANDPARERRAIERLTAQQPPPSPAAAPPPPPAAAPPPPARTQIPQEMTDWVSANDWFRTDQTLQFAMNTVGAELRASGQLVGLNLTEQLNATARVVLKRYAPAPSQGSPRVEGGGRPSGGGTGTPTSDGAPTFESLPAHIKAACDEQGERLGLIGEKRTFKTKDAWRAHYVQQYYGHESSYDFRPPGN